MKFVLKLLLIILLSTPLIFIGVVYLSVAQEPIVEPGGSTLSPRDITKAKNLLKQHDPRSLRNGQIKNLILDSKELNLLGNYLINSLNGQLIVTLNDKILKLQSSFQIPPNKLENYLNLSLLAQQNGDLITIRELQIGNLNLPNWISNLIVKQLLLFLQTAEPTRPFSQSLQSVRITDQQLIVRYKWNPDLLHVARKQFISTEEQERLYHYQKRLIKISNQPNLGRKVSLNHYLNGLFNDARKRSDSNNPVEENRAVLIVLGQHLSGHGHRLLFPETAHLHPARKKITLSERHDFAQHYMISAALSAIGDSQLADLIGLQKELSDSNRSSGFSFTDLAADRAGNYLGKVATESEKSARAVQKFFHFHPKETDYMPSVKGLPEGISARAFKTQYGSVNSEQFNQVEKQIQQRLKETAFYTQTENY
ncbi:MAG: hypothetical protein DRQ56_04620 [Gammaproteobacteria bacterium]|nr:MAG: hypothetical protein DRQ56_04620 [Gammaproteobacteria bacterium]